MFKLDYSKKIIIYGAGEKGRCVCHFMMKFGMNVLFIMDQDETLWGKTITYATGLKVQIRGPAWETGIKPDDSIIICTMENALQHEKAAAFLYRQGYRNIIFLPVLHLESEKANTLIEVYDSILHGDNCIKKDMLLPSYDELNKKELSTGKDSFYGNKWIIRNDRVILYLPVELLYSEQIIVGTAKGDSEKILFAFGDTNVMSRWDYFELWNYLKTGTGDYKIYMQTHCTNGKKGKNAKQEILKDRNELLALYDREFKRYVAEDFFFNSPATGYYNPNGYITIRNGLHRITYLITRGERDVPVEIPIEDYRALGESRKGIQKLILEKRRYYVEHPIGALNRLNTDEDIRKFMFFIQRNYMHFRSQRVLILARDGGYLLRNCLRAGSCYVTYCTQSSDWEWNERVMDFFGFSKARYTMVDEDWSDMKWDNFDCIIADFPSETTLNRILESAAQTLFFRIPENGWGKMEEYWRTQKCRIKTERYWTREDIAVTVQIAKRVTINEQ